MADLLRRFATDDVDPYEWDDFMGIPFKNQLLEELRLRAEGIVGRKPDDTTIDEDEARQLLEIAQEIEAKLRDERS